MKTFDSLPAWRRFREDRPAPGFVPTMGALHDGHMALVRRSLAENSWTAVSIFVNPTQFDRADDHDAYPRRTEDDMARLKSAGVDTVLVPDHASLYPDGYRYRVTESDLSNRLCGAHRPGHFDGVLTVVLKLLNLVRPKRAYFGEKDYQQLQLVRGLADAFFLDTRIMGCPTVRESDGLALSSRNERLSAEQRKLAPQLHHVLTQSTDPASAHEALQRLGFRVDYVEEQDGRRLAAARLGDIRLIDNVPLQEASS